MRSVIVDAGNEQEAKEICREEHGFSPDAIREVDSGEADQKAYMCFESASDAETWDKQK